MSRRYEFFLDQMADQWLSWYQPSLRNRTLTVKGSLRKKKNHKPSFYARIVHYSIQASSVYWSGVIYILFSKYLLSAYYVLGVSLVDQLVKNLPAMQETPVRFLGWEDPLEEGMAIHSSIPAWRIPMDRGSWWAKVHGAAKSWTWLSD